MAFRLKRLLKKSPAVRFASWLAIFNFVDLAAMLLPQKRSASKRKRIVFVKMDGIGDYVIWTATFDALKKIFPSSEYERILVGSTIWQGMAEDEEVFDEKIFVNKKKFISSPSYRFSIMRTVRGLGAETVINPRLTREFLWGDSIVRCSGAKTRIGSRGLDNLMTKAQERISERWYTKLAPPPAVGEHELASCMKLVGTLNSLSTPAIKMPSPAISEPREKLGLPENYAIYFLGAQNADRIWPIGNYAAVAEIVAREFGLKAVICGGPGDEPLAQAFKKAFDGDVIDLIGRTSLPELTSVVGRARLVMTNDTGASHIAVASGAPTVILTPGNQVGRYFPYPSELESSGLRHLPVFHQMPCFGCGWNCIFTDLEPDAPKPCIANITTDEAIAAVRRLLGK